MKLEPAALQSRVKHSTTELLPSLGQHCVGPKPNGHTSDRDEPVLSAGYILGDKNIHFRKPMIQNIHFRKPNNLSANVTNMYSILKPGVDPKFLEKGVHMYKGAGVRFANF